MRPFTYLVALLPIILSGCGTFFNLKDIESIKSHQTAPRIIYGGDWK